MPENPGGPQGHAPSEGEQKPFIVRIGRKQVILFLVGLAAAFGVGAYLWHAFKYFFQDKKYRSMADKAVEGMRALNELLQTINKSDIALDAA